jgi:diguanylate cyclase (GGDEF)-like protein
VALKRRIYVVIVFVALFGSVLGLVLNELTGIASPFVRNLLVASSVFLTLMAALIRTGKLGLGAVEELLYLVPAGLLLCVLFYALYLPASPAQAGSALRGFYLWIPAVYVVVFVAHDRAGAFLRSLALYLIVVGVSLPSALSTLGSAGPLEGFNALSLDQLYISGLVIIVFLFFVTRLRDRLRESEVAAERMKRLAQTDELTGVHNRRHIEYLLESEMDRSRRYDLRLAMVIFDIDDFKALNDAHGHHRGDAVLVEVARLVGDHLRRSDELGRWGGEEFLVVAPETSVGAARELADRLRAVLDDHDFGTASRVSASFGIATLHPADSGTTLVKRADAALYRAKVSGKNRVELGLAEA